MEVLKNEIYSKNYQEHRLLDVYLPDESNGSCIHLIHGGGFETGRKESWEAVAERFAGQGYICITPTYRKRPEFAYPAWVEDIRLAMQYVLLHADEYGYSRDRIITMGSSAGGYQAVVLAVLDENNPLGKTDELTEYATPAGVIPYCPVLRMREGESNWSGAENPENLPESDILKLVSGPTPPMLFIHGTGDELIPYSVSEEAVKVINEKGGAAEIAPLEGVGHGFGYGVRSDAQREALELVDAFLGKVFSA